MTDEQRAGPMPPEWPEDADLPSAARIYDYLLGGSANFKVDRDAAERLLRAMPAAQRLARANRAFLDRAVRFLAGAGIDQFLDVGSGVPTVGNVHEVARSAIPAARVVYVDIDPVAVEHGRALLAGDNRTTAILADLRRPETILAHPDLAATLDLKRPIGLLIVSVLHFIQDVDQPHAAVARLREAAVPGSYLALSHALADTLAPQAAAQTAAVYRATQTGGGQGRTTEEIQAFFGDWQLVPPGLVDPEEWRPDPGRPEDSEPAPCGMLAAVGQRA